MKIRHFRYDSFLTEKGKNIIASSLMFQSIMNYLVYSVYINTPGVPPLLLVSVGSVIFVIATILLLAGFRGQRAQQ